MSKRQMRQEIRKAKASGNFEAAKVWAKLLNFKPFIRVELV